MIHKLIERLVLAVFVWCGTWFFDEIDVETDDAGEIVLSMKFMVRENVGIDSGHI